MGVGAILGTYSLGNSVTLTSAGLLAMSALLAGLRIVDGYVTTYLVVLSLTVIPALVSLVFVNRDQ